MAKQRREEWIGLQEAITLLSNRYERKIAAGYITRLALDGRIESRKRDGRTNEYLKSDLEQLTIRKRAPNKKAAATQ